MKSIVKLPTFTVTVSLAVMVLTNTVALADSSAIQQAWLDDHVVVSVPVATNRVTTINFPGPIEAIDGAGFTVDGKTPGQFQLAHAQGSAFLSVRALFPKAAGNLNIRWNEHTYVFELSVSDTPDSFAQHGSDANAGGGRRRPRARCQSAEIVVVARQGQGVSTC